MVQDIFIAEDQGASLVFREKKEALSHGKQRCHKGRIRNLLKEIGLPMNEPTKIFEDNQSCISIANNASSIGRTKHLDVKFHFVRELITMGEILLVYCVSNENVADIFTKPLDRKSFEKFRSKLGLRFRTQGECRNILVKVLIGY